ncbi:MAG: amidohydrolase family protein [Pseudomonadota bacterium]
MGASDQVNRGDAAYLLQRSIDGVWTTAPAMLSVEGGKIVGISAAKSASTSLVMPALANAHDHGRGLRTLAFGAGDDALEVWIASLGREPATDPYLRAAVAFARMAESGVAALNHCHGSADPHRTVDEAEAVSRAAREIGIRVAFAVPIWGRNPWTYGDPAPFFDRLPPEQVAQLRSAEGTWPSAAAQLAMLDAITAFEHETFSVQYGPVGPQWVDDATLERIAAGSAETGRRVHMHLFETRYQKEWASAAYPGGLLQHLDRIGLLSDRLTVAHGVYLDAEDCALLAARGVTVSLNSSSNLRLRSGLAPVATYLAAGVRFGLGLDGLAFDDDEDALRELRVAWRLQRGWGADDVLTRDRLLDAALIDGRRSILGADGGGTIAPGAPADILTLDTARITGDILEGGADLVDLLVARARNEDVRGLHVGGRAVVVEGRATGIDRAAAEVELLAQARASGCTPLTSEDHAVRAALAAYYRCGCHTNLG